MGGEGTTPVRQVKAVCKCLEGKEPVRREINDWTAEGLEKGREGIQGELGLGQKERLGF